MKVRESTPLARQSIQVRRDEPLGTEAADVGVPLIVGKK
jgi:hypothetical protein